MFGRAAWQEARHWFRYLLITSERDAKDKPKNVRTCLTEQQVLSDRLTHNIYTAVRPR